MILPALVLISFLVKFKLGTPVLFKQVRPGLNGNPFMIYKFRSMSEKRDREGELLPDDQRMTSFGNFLRRSSLDELPELVNVVKGEMSLVGPRPLLMEYLEYYTTEQSRRHEVKPGLTGWAQVNGRNAITWEDKFKFDLWYVDNLSFSLDLRILWLTLVKVIRREGINQRGHATAERFKGKGCHREET